MSELKKRQERLIETAAYDFNKPMKYSKSPVRKVYVIKKNTKVEIVGNPNQKINEDIEEKKIVEQGTKITSNIEQQIFPILFEVEKKPDMKFTTGIHSDSPSRQINKQKKIQTQSQKFSCEIENEILKKTCHKRTPRANKYKMKSPSNSPDNIFQSPERKTPSPNIKQLKKDQNLLTPKKSTPKKTTPKQKKNRGSESQTGSSKKKKKFKEYLDQAEIEKGIQDNTLFKGIIRINPHNIWCSYVTTIGFKRDILIEGFSNRNRAFEGDVVVVKLYDESEWKVLKKEDENVIKELIVDLLEEEIPSEEANTLNKVFEKESEQRERDLKKFEELPQKENEVTYDDLIDKERTEKNIENESQFSLTPLVKQLEKLNIDSPKTKPEKVPNGELQPTGFVVGIFESKHTKQQVGYLRPFNGEEVEPEDTNVAFNSINPCNPKVLVPIIQIPEFYRNWRLFENQLVQVEILEWKATQAIPKGKYKGIVGEAGEIGPETEAILIQYRIDNRDFPSEVMKCVRLDNWKIPESELKLRRDFRDTRIFTVDPSTAKDLDDALHCTVLSDGNFEVGVHIADVSFFVSPGTALDEVAKSRATTVYLVQKAIPMLPPILCENLCSLNPGVDRLAFSVVWKLSPKGEILHEWFGKSIIRSCSKMSYDIAQSIIEGKITQSWTDTGSEIYHPDLGPVGKHTVSDIVQDILNMNTLAQILRKKRFENGALSVNNVKITFKLNSVGNPSDFYQYITKEANHMVEEFMLLANQQVAARIVKYFPDTALLRNHVSPLPNKLEVFSQFCSKYLKIPVDLKDGKSFHTSLDYLRNHTSPTIFSSVQLLATRCFQLAKYFCTGNIPEEEWKHYALNVNFYTHFTSPIRRYPDLVVHRLLSASISQDQLTFEELKDVFSLLPSKEQMNRICDNCNDKKLASRKAQEASAHLFLCLILKDNPRYEDAVVIGTGKSLSILLPSFGCEKKIFLEDVFLNSFECKESVLSLNWPTLPNEKTESSILQEITISSLLRVRVSCVISKCRPTLEASLIHPKEIEKFPPTTKDIPQKKEMN